MTSSTISIIIPAHNERDRIGETVQAARAALPSSEVIVVNDGSTDDTELRSAEAGAKVISHSPNRGKGQAMNIGAAAATGSILLFLDADLGSTASQAKILVDPVSSGEADLSIATFPIIPGKGGGMGIVVKTARWGIRMATGRVMTAPLSGQRAISKAAFEIIGPFQGGFSVETSMTIDALIAGLRVVEIPTTMTHRVTGRDWAARRHRLKQWVAVVKALWRHKRLLLSGPARSMRKSAR